MAAYLLIALSLSSLVGRALPAPRYDDDGQHPVRTERVAPPDHPADWAGLAQEELQRSFQQKQPKIATAKNLILFIGDGMGASTVTSGRWLKAQSREVNEDSHTVHLSWDRFPFTGLAKTYNTDQITADSAGTANAFACGVKTRAAVIGVNQDVVRGDCQGVEGNELDSIITTATKEGKWTGIVTTTRVTHATPAAAYAHAADRDWEADNNMPANLTDQCHDIGYQLVHNEGNEDIRVIMGGGRERLLPRDTVDPEYPERNGTRLDGRDLIQEWVDKHEEMDEKSLYVRNKEEFDAVDAEETNYLLGLFEPGHMQFEADRETGPEGEPSLAEMVEKAIEILQRNDDGFVLYVEGGRIDHAHHDANAYRALVDVLALDDAVSMAEHMTNEEDTLIVVTADHSHSFNLNGYPNIENDIFDVAWEFVGEPAMADDDKPWLVLSYANGPGWYEHRSVNDSERKNLTGDNEPPLSGDARKEYLQDGAVPLYSETHAGEEVAVYAHGPMSYLFTGVYEQSYIPHAMLYTACLGANKEHCNRDTSAAALNAPRVLVIVFIVFLGGVLH